MSHKSIDMINFTIVVVSLNLSSDIAARHTVQTQEYNPTVEEGASVFPHCNQRLAFDAAKLALNAGHLWW